MDRAKKWLHCLQIPSLQEYIFVSLDQPRAERFRRKGRRSREYTAITDGGIEVVSKGVPDVTNLYDDLADLDA